MCRRADYDHLYGTPEDAYVSPRHNNDGRPRAPPVVYNLDDDDDMDTYNRPGNTENLGQVRHWKNKTIKEFVNRFFENCNRLAGVEDHNIIWYFRSSLMNRNIFCKLYEAAPKTVGQMMQFDNVQCNTEEAVQLGTPVEYMRPHRNDYRRDDNHHDYHHRDDRGDRRRNDRYHDDRDHRRDDRDDHHHDDHDNYRRDDHDDRHREEHRDQPNPDAHRANADQNGEFQ
ncbi:probable cell wall mannoprotein PIR32 [Setaria italica]|uniref:probable cell wall mannoprotein PIR32 n=1 Tax=Setaria italica TaxID=4555 RepID=UPI00064877D0|nr:probable cell wall mannoprotein PIR32 [Setaria italica]